MVAGGALRFYHGDHLGSSNVITDGTGALVELAEYRPYGALARREGSVEVPQKFTGQRLDPTGFYFYQARYYDPTLGRFLQADPIVPSPGDPQALNRYSYVRNNPLKYTDPTGHGWFSNFFKKLGQALLSAALAVTTLFLAAIPGGQPFAVLTAKATYITAASAAVATITLNTGEGRQFQRRFANEVFDDALGFSPRTAAVASSVVSHAALTWGVEQFAIQTLLDPGTPAPTGDIITEENAGRSLLDIAKDGQGDAIHTLLTSQGKQFQYALVQKQGLFGVIPLDVFGPLKATLQPFQRANVIGWQHVASSGQSQLFSGVAKVFHGTLKGLCVNEANLAAATMGLSWTASQAAGATYTTYLTEMVYGTYGNQLSNAALNWVTANHNYHADN